MKILVDMNLSPQWCEVLRQEGHLAVHCSDINATKASDREIMDWACREGHIVFTHDLDFGAILAFTQAKTPSVIQIRGQNVLPSDVGDILLGVLRKFETELREGALITIDETKMRIRILPLQF
jgi:predicted nuclease of predicted toxin-antitoxin system